MAGQHDTKVEFRISSRLLARVDSYVEVVRSEIPGISRADVMRMLLQQALNKVHPE